MAQNRTFDPDCRYGHETMRGTPAKIIYRDLRGTQPLVVILTEETEDTVETYSPDGCFLFGSPDSMLNLRNREAP